MPILEMTTGETLRAYRLRRKFTLRELEALTGIPHSMIGYYERDKAPPPFDRACQLCKALGISVETLAGESAAALADDIPLP